MGCNGSNRRSRKPLKFRRWWLKNILICITLGHCRHVPHFMGVCDVPCKPFLQVIDAFTADYCMQRTVGMGDLQIGVTASVPDGTLSITVRRCARRLTVVFDRIVTVRSRVDQATAKKADKSHYWQHIYSATWTFSRFIASLNSWTKLKHVSLHHYGTTEVQDNQCSPA